MVGPNNAYADEKNESRDEFLPFLSIKTHQRFHVDVRRSVCLIHSLRGGIRRGDIVQIWGDIVREMFLTHYNAYNYMLLGRRHITQRFVPLQQQAQDWPAPPL